MRSDVPRQPGAPPGSLVLEHAGLARPDQRAQGHRNGHPGHHAVTRYEAIRLHTADAAQPTGAGQTRGTLAPGKLVDFAAYPTDPFTCPAEELARLLPVLTVVGGHPRHDPHGLALHSATLPTAAASS